MSGVWGNKIKISIFGESHGGGIGCVLSGIPQGIFFDRDFVLSEMARRAPGFDELSTARREVDIPRVLSGIFNDHTTGAPIACVIDNTDMHSKDYTKTAHLMRPGHADYTGHVKYDGFNDFRGGGHFSGRITAPLVFAGAVAKLVLKGHGVEIGAHIHSIKGICDTPFHLNCVDEQVLQSIDKVFPVIDMTAGDKMKQAILDAKFELDSVGGVVECAILNASVGVGNPFFGSVESVLSSLLYSIPAVKGVEFGAGFGFCNMLGSEANDEFYYDKDNVKTKTNNNGGINGGIANGMPIVFRVAIKPTASISKEQNTIDIDKKVNAPIKIHGRHDPCIVKRAVVVVEAAAALAMADMI